MEHDRVQIFASFEAENAAEHRRLRTMSPAQRLREFAELQERAWGERWTQQPMPRIASWEEPAWAKPRDTDH